MKNKVNCLFAICLLALVAAFAGRENTLRAYRHAVQANYRFYSYGDCMWIRSAGLSRSAWRFPVRASRRPIVYNLAFIEECT